MKKLLIIPLLLLSLFSKAQISGFELMPRLSVPSLTYRLWNGGTRHLVLDKDSAALIFASLASPAFIGVPTVPTASPGTNTTQAASTAYVVAAVAGGGGSVSSVFSRTGAVVAASNDYTFAQIGTKPTTISGYGITDFNSTGDARYLQLTGGALTGALTSNNSASFSGNITSTGGSFIASGLTSTGTNVGIGINNRPFTSAGTAIAMAALAVSNSSGVFVGVNITPTYTQTSTAGATDFKINRTETSIGSGSQLLADFQVGSVSKFSIDRIGVVTVGGAISLIQTGGLGFILGVAQSSKPSTPASGSLKSYFDASARPSWIGSNGFAYTFDATANIADAVYTLPSATATLVGTATTQTLTNKTITSSTNTLGGVTMSIGSDAVGDLHVTTTSNVLSKIADIATGAVLTSGGIGVLPSWSTNPNISGSPTTTSQAQYDNSTKISTTAYVDRVKPDNVANQAANYTILTTDWIAGKTNVLRMAVDATSGNVTITFPSAASLTGYVIYVTKIDASVNTVTPTSVIGAGVLVTTNQSLNYYSDGAVWRPQ